MKIKILLFAALALLTFCSLSFADEEKIEMLTDGINLTGGIAMNSVSIANPVIVDFTGFKLIGDIVKEKRGESEVYIINRGAGFIFPKNHPAGVLRVVMEKPSDSIHALFSEYPYVLEPFDVTIDGNPIVLQVSADSVFVYIDIKDGNHVVISSTSFVQDGQSTGSGTDKDVQIKIKPKYDIPVNMQTLLQKTK